MVMLTRPVLVYDGDCGFCICWVERWKRMAGESIEYAPSDQAMPRFPWIPRERFRDSVVLIEPDGRVSTGAEAVFRSLSRARRGRLGVWLYEHVVPFARISEWVYRLVAGHRAELAGVTGCSGKRRV